MIGQRVPLHLWFPLGKLQGPVPKLLMKKPSKGPAILDGMLDIVVDFAKQGVLSLLFSGWP